MAVALCDVHIVMGSSSIRSHFDGRIKGESRSSNIRQLTESESRRTKHAGNLLRTFDEVVSFVYGDNHRILFDAVVTNRNVPVCLSLSRCKWSDASSVKAASNFAMKCIKRKKSKKKGGPGLGNGIGKGGKGGDASGVAVTASNSTSSSNSKDSATGTNSTASSSGSNSTASSSGSNSTRLLDSTTNTTNSTVTTSNNMTVLVIVENKGGTADQSKKGRAPPKFSEDGFLFCDEDEGDVAVGTPSSPVAVGTPSAPDVSPVTSPVGSPSAAVGSPVAVSAPVVATPSGFVVFPAAAPSGAQASVCEAYEYGEAPTSAPSQNFTAFMIMTVNASSDIDSIYSQMGAILREEIAPMLLNCDSMRRKATLRQLQDNATELVNIRFADPTADPSGKFSCSVTLLYLTLSYQLTPMLVLAGSCTPPSENSTTCVPCMFTSQVFYYGEQPVGFGDKLLQAILYEEFDIPGLQSFEDVQVNEEDSVDGPNADPTQAPGSTDRGLPTPTTSPVEATTRSSTNGPNPGAFVAVAAAALTVILLAMFIVRRRRDTTVTGSQAKHLEFTDDFEEDVGGETGDDNSAVSPIPPPPRRSYILSDHSFDDSWNSTGQRLADEGQEVYNASDAMMRRQQSQTRFLTTEVGLDPTLMDLPKREYETDDTVNL